MIKQGNDKIYNTISERYFVPMRDGVKLSVHVHRPDSKEKFPAIIDYTPYRKGSLKESYDPAKPHHVLKYGYACVDFDIRGTGDSEGWNDSIYSDVEQKDGYYMIEWVASQSWCNGNVGMWGISFGGVVTLQQIMAASPHLKAVIVRSGTDDVYAEWTNPGGSPRPYMYNCYAPIMAASNFSPPDPDEVGENWSKIWEERLKKNVPWGISFLQNLKYGSFWEKRALRGKYDKVKAAVFLVSGWADWYYNPLLRTFINLDVPKHIIVGPWSHNWPDVALPGPRIDWPYEAKRWFDYWLKGIDNGIMDEPPVRLFIREYSKPKTFFIEDKGYFRSEKEYPIKRAQKTPLYLENDSKLSFNSPDKNSNSKGDILSSKKIFILFSNTSDFMFFP